MTFFRTAAVLTAMILLPLHAAAQGTPEQRAACTGDALQFCGEYVPNVEMITACLRKNVRQISPACQDQFRPRSARARPRAGPVADGSAHKHQLH